MVAAVARDALVVIRPYRPADIAFDLRALLIEGCVPHAKLRCLIDHKVKVVPETVGLSLAITTSLEMATQLLPPS